MDLNIVFTQCCLKNWEDITSEEYQSLKTRKAKGKNLGDCTALQIEKLAKVNYALYEFMIKTVNKKTRLTKRIFDYKQKLHLHICLGNDLDNSCNIYYYSIYNMDITTLDLTDNFLNNRVLEYLLMETFLSIDDILCAEEIIAQVGTKQIWIDF